MLVKSVCNLSYTVFQPLGSAMFGYKFLKGQKKLQTSEKTNNPLLTVPIIIA